MRGGAVLTAGSLVSSVASLLRNIVVARLISVDDFGIAATFALTLSLAEMASDIGLQRLLVQDPDGDDPRMQAVAQAFQAFRGLVSSAVLFLLAGPVATLFEIPEVTWAFRVLAVWPLLRGLAHLDMYRIQREMRFGPAMCVEVFPQLVAVAIAVPLGMWLGDYRVMLWILVAQMSLYTLASHVVAKRRYAWAYDKSTLKRMVQFGWPLLVNGMLMFGISQGDHLVVGSMLTMEDLGWYAAAYTLLLAPTNTLAKILQSYFLPLLSSVQDDAAMYGKRAAATSQACMCVGVAFAVGAMTCGDDLLVAMYGDKYAPAARVVPWLAAMHGLRIVRTAQSVVAIGKADTRNPMYANIVRIVSIAFAYVMIVLGFGVEGVAASGFAGEFLAFVWSQRLLKARFNLSARPILSCAAVAAIGVGLVGAGILGLDRQRPILFTDFAVAVALSGVVAFAILAVSRELRDMLRRHMPRLNAVIPRVGLGEADVRANDA